MFNRILTVLLLASALARAEDLEQAVQGYLLAASENPPPPATPWDVSGALGLAVTQNGDAITLTFNFEGKREWDDLWKLALKIYGVYEETDNVTTSSEYAFTERLDRKLTEKSALFQTLYLEYDEIEDLDLRLIFTVGYTRKLVEKEKFKLDGDVGVGWMHEDYTNTTNDDLIGQLGLRFEWQITKTLTYKQVFEYYPKLTDTPEFRFVSASTFTTPISDKIDANLVILDQYNSDTQAGPPNDFKLLLTISIQFTKKKK